MITLVAAACCFSALAGTHTGTVQEILVGRGGNQMYLKLTDSPNGFACSANAHPNGWEWSIDMNVVDDAVISAIYLAKATGTQIYIQWASKCSSFHSGLENVGYVILKNS